MSITSPITMGARSPDSILVDALKLSTFSLGSASHPISQFAGRSGYKQNQEREAHLRGVWDVYNNVFHDELIDPGEPDAQGKIRGQFPLNHLPRWLALWSAIYSEDLPRHHFFKSERVKEDDKEQATVDTLRKYQLRGGREISLQRVDSYMRLLGNCVIKPYYDEVYDTLSYNIYKSYRVRVVENPNNPTYPFATIISGVDKQVNEDGSYTAVPIAEIWIPSGPQGGRVVFVRNKSVESSEEYQGYTPLVHCFDTPPDNESGYFVDAPGPDLADLAVRLINDGYSDINYTSVMQGFGVAQVFGFEGQKITVGPGRVLQFSGDPDKREGVEFANPNAPLTERMDVLESLVSHIRDAYGIPKSMLNVETDASGAAIVQANGPLAEIRKERAKVFRPIETNLLRAELAVLAGRVEGIPATIDPMDWDVSVNFEKQQASHSVGDQIALENHDLEHNLTTPAELLMKRRPDEFDSEEDAEKLLMKRSEGKIERAQEIKERLGMNEEGTEDEEEEGRALGADKKDEDEGDEES